MDKLDLILKTFSGSNNEKILYSFWKHFPEIDRNPEELAYAHVEYYEKFKFDLMKISPHGRYAVIDFGCELDDYYDPISGSSTCKNTIVKNISDWEKLEPIDVNTGEFGKQIKTVEIIQKKVENTLPKMMTIFSPLMVASKLDGNLEKNCFLHPNIILDAIRLLEKVMTEFALSSIDAGCEGLFIASQHLRKEKNLLEWAQIERFELNIIKSMINKLKKKTDFTVFHLHGQDVFFESVAKNLPVDAINWHDKTTWPSIVEASDISSKGLLAGLDEKGVLMKGEKDSIIQSTNHSLEDINKTGNRTILSPGCVIPTPVEDSVLEVIQKQIENYNKNRF